MGAPLGGQSPGPLSGAPMIMDTGDKAPAPNPQFAFPPVTSEAGDEAGASSPPSTKVTVVLLAP